MRTIRAGTWRFEAVKRTKANGSRVVTAQGNAVKMVYLLLRDLPANYEYRVILMRRDRREVMARQRTC
jgi:hypothetical protein